MSTRFIFLTDTHHYPDAPKDYGAPKMLTQSQKVIDATVPAINALAPQFIIHGGDLLCGGSSFELPSSTYIRSVQEVAEAFSRFEAPIYYLPGNHDCDAQNASYEIFSQHFSIPETIQVFEAAPRVRVVTVNVYQCDPITEMNGIWTEELDQGLRDAARAATEDGCALVLALHTWIIPYGFEQDHVEPTGNIEHIWQSEPIGVIYHADRLVETIRTHPAIVMVLTGHRHINRIRRIHDCWLLDTACVIGYPMGFREIIMQDDGTIVTNFHQIDLPDLIQASYDRSTAEENQVWAGTTEDQNAVYMSPRLKALWR